MDDMVITLHAMDLPVAGVMPGERKALRLPEGSTVNDLLRLLAKEDDYEELTACTIAINNEVAALKSLLHNGDEVFMVRVMGGG